MGGQPGKRAFHDPAARQEQEARGARWTQDRLKAQAKADRHPIEQLTAIDAIDPDEAQLFAESA